MQKDWIKSTKPKNYLPVFFPESQLFMDDYHDQIFLINDKEGIEKFGYASYYVEVGLYKKVMAEFEKEIESTPTFIELNI